MNREFIVAYSGRKLDIYDALVYPEMKELYDFAISHNRAKYGDIVGWNNQFWWSVSAEYSKEAFDVFFKRFQEEEEAICAAVSRYLQNT